jgi:hypothetical protein
MIFYIFSKLQGVKREIGPRMITDTYLPFSLQQPPDLTIKPLLRFPPHTSGTVMEYPTFYFFCNRVLRPSPCRSEVARWTPARRWLPPCQRLPQRLPFLQAPPLPYLFSWNLIPLLTERSSVQWLWRASGLLFLGKKWTVSGAGGLWVWWDVLAWCWCEESTVGGESRRWDWVRL